MPGAGLKSLQVPSSLCVEVSNDDRRGAQTRCLPSREIAMLPPDGPRRRRPCCCPACVAAGSSLTNGVHVMPPSLEYCADPPTRTTTSGLSHATSMSLHVPMLRLTACPKSLICPKRPYFGVTLRSSWRYP